MGSILANASAFDRFCAEGLNPPFLSDLAIRLVDGRNLLCGDREKLPGDTARHQLIGMVLQHQSAVVALQLVIADRGVDAQYVVGVALRYNRMAHLDVAELDFGDAKTLGDLAEKLHLRGCSTLSALAM